uniref:Uncharacterized protein n=1 Tax=Fagus sylvatica TaxID=28930 RepID=A0A2N9EZK7_FAGSY
MRWDLPCNKKINNVSKPRQIRNIKELLIQESVLDRHCLQGIFNYKSRQVVSYYIFYSLLIFNGKIKFLEQEDPPNQSSLCILLGKKPEIEIIEQTLEDVDPSTALVLATLTPDAKPLSQQPLLDIQIIKVDIEDLSEPEVDQLIKRALFVLEEMKSASKASTSTSSKISSSPVSQGMNAVIVMRSILEQPLDNLVYDSELRNRFQESTDFLLSQSNLLTEDMLGMLALFSESLDSKLLQISTAISNEKEIQSIQKGYDEKITAKSEFQQEFEQTLKKYEDTKQEISKVRKELQRLENVKDLTQMKLQDLLKQKDNIIDSSTELSLEEKITSLTTEVSRLRRIPEAVWNYLRNSFNNFQL